MMIRMKHPQHGFHMALGIEVPEMKKHGWTEDVPDVAPEAEKAPMAEVADAEHDALIARADELNIKVDKRWSDARLAAEIEKAEAAQAGKEAEEE